MKWINLAVRQPDDLHSVARRSISNKEFLYFTEYRYTHDKRLYCVGLQYPYHMHMADVEWLDETDENDFTYEELEQRYVTLGEAYTKLLLEYNELRNPKDGYQTIQVPEGTFVVPNPDLSNIGGYSYSEKEGYNPDEYPENFWEGISDKVRYNFSGLQYIISPKHHEIFHFYLQVIDTILEDKPQKNKPQIMTAFELHGKDCRGDLDKFKKFLQDYFPDETRWILAEQHRNTRHDAIETLHTSFTRYVDDPNQTDFDFVRAASRDIHNLLIRRESWTNK